MTLRGKAKAMPSDMNAAGAMPEAEGESYTNGQPVITGMDEPFGSQVIRRLHEWATLRLTELHAMLRHLEHEPTKKLLVGKLEGIVDELEELEGHHQKFYKDVEGVEPLEGADLDADGKPKESKPKDAGGKGKEDEAEDMAGEGAVVPDFEDEEEKDKDLEDGAPKADSEITSGDEKEEEEMAPTPQEAFEGSQIPKDTADKNEKKNPFEKKDDKPKSEKKEGGEKKEEKKDDKPKSDKGDKGEKKEDKKDDKKKDEKSLNGHVCAKCQKDFPEMNRQVGAAKVTHPSGQLKAPKKDPMQQFGTKDVSGGPGGDSLGVEQGHVPHSEAAREEHASGAFKPHQHCLIGQVAGYMKKVGEGQDWSPQHQMEAYHHHENLGDIVKELDTTLASTGKSFPSLDAGLDMANVQQGAKDGDGLRFDNTFESDLNPMLQKPDGRSQLGSGEPMQQFEGSTPVVTGETPSDAEATKGFPKADGKVDVAGMLSQANVNKPTGVLKGGKKDPMQQFGKDVHGGVPEKEAYENPGVGMGVEGEEHLPHNPVEEHGSGPHPHHVSLKNCHSLLGQMYKLKSIGLHHREAAMKAHKELSEIHTKGMGGMEGGSESTTGGELPPPSGAMGSEGMGSLQEKSLMDQILEARKRNAEQRNALAETRKQFADLVGRLNF